MLRHIGATILLFAMVEIMAPVSVWAEEVSLEVMSPLLGEWRGVGEGKWGQSAIERRYSSVFDGAFIQGHGRSVYPRQEKNPSGEIHETIDMYSFDQNRKTVVLRQFDNEDFVSTYYLNLETQSVDKMEFISEHLENVPEGWRARVLFEFTGDSEYQEHFDLDTATGSFQRYVTARFYRVPEAGG
jgi:hypothetical protein